LLNWKTFEPKDDPELTLVALNLCEKIHKAGGKNADNYSSKNFDLDSQVAISLGFRDDECLGIATLQKRPIYGAKVLRTMNRYWRAAEERVGYLGRTNDLDEIDSLVLLPAHISVAKRHGYESLFISRQTRALRYFAWLSRLLTLKIGHDWSYSSEKVLVCPNMESASCWQYVIFCSLNNGTIPEPVKSLRSKNVRVGTRT
jgi:hypothetical protein